MDDYHRSFGRASHGYPRGNYSFPSGRVISRSNVPGPIRTSTRATSAPRQAHKTDEYLGYYHYPMATSAQVRSAGGKRPLKMSKQGRDPSVGEWYSFSDDREPNTRLRVNQLFLNIVRECQDHYDARIPAGFDGTREQTQELREYLRRGLAALGLEDKITALETNHTIRGIPQFLSCPTFVQPHWGDVWETYEENEGWKAYRDKLMRSSGESFGSIRGGADPKRQGQDEREITDVPWTNPKNEWAQLKKDARLPVEDLPKNFDDHAKQSPFMYPGADMGDDLRAKFSREFQNVIKTQAPRYNAIQTASAEDLVAQRDYVGDRIDVERLRMTKFLRSTIDRREQGRGRFLLKNRNSDNEEFLEVLTAGFLTRAYRIIHIAAMHRLYELGEVSIIDLMHAEIQLLTSLRLQEEVWREYDSFRLSDWIKNKKTMDITNERIELRKSLDEHWEERIHIFQEEIASRGPRKTEEAQLSSLLDADVTDAETIDVPANPRTRRAGREPEYVEVLKRIRKANEEARERTIAENDQLSDGDVGNHQLIHANNLDIMAKNNTIFSLDVEIENARSFDPLAKKGLGFGASHRLTLPPADEYWRDTKRIRGNKDLPTSIRTLSGNGPLPGEHPVPGLPKVIVGGPSNLGEAVGTDTDRASRPMVDLAFGFNANDIPVAKQSGPAGGPKAPANQLPPTASAAPTTNAPPAAPTGQTPTQLSLFSGNDQPPKLDVQQQQQPADTTGFWTIGQVLSDLQGYDSLMPPATRNNVNCSLQVWSEVFSTAWRYREYKPSTTIPLASHWNLDQFSTQNFNQFCQGLNQASQAEQETNYYRGLVSAQASFFCRERLNWTEAMLLSGCAIVRSLGPRANMGSPGPPVARYLLTIAEFLRIGPELTQRYRDPRSETRVEKQGDPTQWSMQGIASMTFSDYVRSLPPKLQRNTRKAMQEYTVIKQSIEGIRAGLGKTQGPPKAPKTAQPPAQSVHVPPPQPSRPSQPTQPTRPSQPSQPTQPTQPTQQTQPKEPLQQPLPQPWNSLSGQQPNQPGKQPLVQPLPQPWKQPPQQPGKQPGRQPLIQSLPQPWQPPSQPKNGPPKQPKQAPPMQPRQAPPTQPAKSSRPTQPGWTTASNVHGPRQWSMRDIETSNFEDFWNTLPANAKKDRQAARNDWMLIQDSWTRIKHAFPAAAQAATQAATQAQDPNVQIHQAQVPPSQFPSEMSAPTLTYPQLPPASAPPPPPKSGKSTSKSTFPGPATLALAAPEPALSEPVPSGPAALPQGDVVMSGGPERGRSHPSVWTWPEWERQGHDWNHYIGELYQWEQEWKGYPEKMYYIWRQAALRRWTRKRGKASGAPAGPAMTGSKKGAQSTRGGSKTSKGSKTTKGSKGPSGSGSGGLGHPSTWSWPEWQDNGGNWSTYMGALTQRERQTRGYPERYFYVWRTEALRRWLRKNDRGSKKTNTVSASVPVGPTIKTPAIKTPPSKTTTAKVPTKETPTTKTPTTKTSTTKVPQPWSSAFDSIARPERQPYPIFGNAGLLPKKSGDDDDISSIHFTSDSDDDAPPPSKGPVPGKVPGGSSGTQAATAPPATTSKGFDWGNLFSSDHVSSKIPTSASLFGSTPKTPKSTGLFDTVPGPRVSLDSIKKQNEQLRERARALGIETRPGGNPAASSESESASAPAPAPVSDLTSASFYNPPTAALGPRHVEDEDEFIRKISGIKPSPSWIQKVAAVNASSAPSDPIPTLSASPASQASPPQPPKSGKITKEGPLGGSASLLANSTALPEDPLSKKIQNAFGDSNDEVNPGFWGLTPKTPKIPGLGQPSGNAGAKDSGAKTPSTTVPKSGSGTSNFPTSNFPPPRTPKAPSTSFWSISGRRPWIDNKTSAPARPPVSGPAPPVTPAKPSGGLQPPVTVPPSTSQPASTVPTTISRPSGGTKSTIPTSSGPPPSASRPTGFSTPRVPEPESKTSASPARPTTTATTGPWAPPGPWAQPGSPRPWSRQIRWDPPATTTPAHSAPPAYSVPPAPPAPPARSTPLAPPAPQAPTVPTPLAGTKRPAPDDEPEPEQGDGGAGAEEEQRQYDEAINASLMQAIPNRDGYPDLKYLIRAYKRAGLAEQALAQRPDEGEGYAAPLSEAKNHYPVPIWKGQVSDL